MIHFESDIGRIVYHLFTKKKYRKNLPIPAKIAIFAVKYGNKLADKLEVWTCLTAQDIQTLYDGIQLEPAVKG